MTKQDTILIVGLGLMGGSYAMAMAQKGYTVWAADTDEQSISWAVQNGMIARGSTQASELLPDADIVILGLYPQAILPWLKANISYFKKGALLSDLAGVKACYLDAAQQLLGQHHEYIACHPMAGREKSGVQNADPKIFAGANFIVTPTSRNSQSGVAFARQLAQELGFAHITTLEPTEHDAMIGYVSQLTHAIAVSLMNANDDARLPSVTGDSFRDLTRIANMNAPLWSELFLANKAALAEEIDTFSACLQDLKHKLLAGDDEALQALFTQSTQRRLQFDKDIQDT